MSNSDQQYRKLPETTRGNLNELTNHIFRTVTRFDGKIDPKTQPELAGKWIDIRDQVLANQQKFASWLQTRPLLGMGYAPAVQVFQSLEALEASVPAWITIARGELGTHEIAGAQHNPKIMGYIRTCANVQGTSAQRRFVEREGEEGVEWCSAFVNWCLQRAGIIGTNHASASSWTDWGTRLSEPRPGAIVCFNWHGGHHIDHVAFCDKVNGQLKTLGGNQSGGGGGQVSSVPFKQHAARAYRWPNQTGGMGALATRLLEGLQD